MTSGSPPGAPIRVLAIDHTAGVAPFRRKFAAIAAYPEIELTVLAPARWVENYRTVRLTASDLGLVEGYRLRAGSVVWPGYENRGFFTSGLVGAMRAARPDILHLWEEPFSFIALQALLLRRAMAPSARAIFFSSDNLNRDFRYPYRPSWVYAAIERFAHLECEAGTAVSADVEAVLRAKGYRGPVSVIPHGIDLERYAASDVPDREAIEERAARPLGLRPPIVGYVGRLTEQKGVDTLIRAFAAMSELPGAPPASLAIVGDGPARPVLERLVNERSLGARVRFFAPVPHESVPEVLAAFRVVVLPSRTMPRLVEQFGRILVEGMAAGCVVIGSSSGAVPSVIADAGIVVAEGDEPALTAAMERVLRDPELAATLRAMGRDRVRSNYTWEAVSRSVVRLYRELMG
jgi:glycosyltransferase involved in cell wall biosynthesis